MLRGAQRASRTWQSLNRDTLGSSSLLQQLSNMSATATSAIADLLGPVVNTQHDTISTADIKADYVGLYFSASWCPPCRRFTPKLVQCYKGFLQQPGNESTLEIVLVSSDREEGDAVQYFGGMPWKMLPYSERDRKATLSSLYKVQLVLRVMYACLSGLSKVSYVQLATSHCKVMGCTSGCVPSQGCSCRELLLI
jgi:thiol-disulfide isomerase/thioredoxin